MGVVFFLGAFVLFWVGLFGWVSLETAYVGGECDGG